MPLIDSATATLKGLGDPPELPLRHAALQELARHVGEHEESENRGAIVQWALEGFADLPEEGPGPKWCAYAVSQAFRQVLLARKEDARLAEWMRIASGSVDALWERLQRRGWTWQPHEDTPHDLRVPGEQLDIPAAADLIFEIGIKDGRRVFHRDGRPDLVHVSFAERFPAPPLIGTVGGNQRNGVTRGVVHWEHPRTYGAARVML